MTNEQTAILLHGMMMEVRALKHLLHGAEFPPPADPNFPRTAVPELVERLEKSIEQKLYALCPEQPWYR